MKKLKKKVFLVIFLILTLVSVGALSVYNVQLYRQQYGVTERLLSNTFAFGFGKGVMDRPDGEQTPPEMGEGSAPEGERAEFDRMRFLDATVYTVFLDDSGKPDAVINHSDAEITEEEITAVAETLLAEGGSGRIGNLYTTPYSYALQRNSLIIVDNAQTNRTLRNTLLVSLGAFLLLELLIVLLARLLTRWIAKPVAESFEKQKQFIADASHELKTPLAVIIASADALESNPEETKWLENIKSESDRMSKLIADLLELAKSEEGPAEEMTVGSLSKPVEKATLTFEGLMFEKGIVLNDDIEDGIELKMNAYKIQQLMSILLDNAIKHSAPGGEIAVTLKKDKDIVLTVTNEGEGIPKGEEEKIFERFYRADESRNRNENRYGLGLAIARNICEAHGAQISAASENGKTTFKVVFKTK